MAKIQRNEGTRERILKRAETLFAQKGYKAVSIREIIQSAHCNLAAVNYHFGQKKNLYLEVFRSRWIPRARRTMAAYRKLLGPSPPKSPADIVRALTLAFLEGPFSEEERYRHSQLMAKELAQPSEAFDLIVDEVKGPFFKELASTFRTVLPEPVDEETLMLNMISLFAQVIHFNFARASVSRLTGREYDPAFKARLCEHIINFSLNGLGAGKKGARH